MVVVVSVMSNAPLPRTHCADHGGGRSKRTVVATDTIVHIPRILSVFGIKCPFLTMLINPAPSLSIVPKGAGDRLAALRHEPLAVDFIGCHCANPLHILDG
jgi:hypothetical protein